ncbi:probable serine/threonine-protein kinase WNK11 [Arachis ipaensis]|nr:probable serine/threonine-protein kinase WNK11 [Arachis ipaensis]XP_020960138.1 probable serine/threonine-protein kinase WNK11 [Arachis ipaensis]XP_025630994.1 probable serine/threonine-protein kinase WNK11 [Arachis hypogaea]
MMPGAKVHPSYAESETFIEMDPTGRYVRYPELLGSGSVKRVYRAFDKEEGIEVAWNQVRLKNFNDDPVMVHRLHSEIMLLRGFSNDHIISLFAFWKDDVSDTLNFITEVCSSGSMREYRKRHKNVSMKAVKKWSKQILEGLNYLHTHDPCIIHRDLNCSNVFVNGNTGQVKIGDLGLAAVVGRSHSAHSVLGTPEFMAPELYSEKYTEKVDIYSFGMCVLEMVTREIPYSECESVVKIYKKVTSGVRPQSLNKINNSELKSFIHKCIAHPPSARPSAAQLLQDPFFHDLHS